MVNPKRFTLNLIRFTRLGRTSLDYLDSIEF